MKKLAAYIRAEIIGAIIYRGDVLIFVLGGIAEPLVLLAVWLAIIRSGGQAPLGQSGLISYYLFLLLINLVTSAWSAPFIASKIRYGKLSPYLLKPFPYILQDLGSNLGEKVVKATYIVPVFLVLFLAFNLSIPKISPVLWLLFVLTLVLASAIHYLSDVIQGLLSFWLDDTGGIIDLLGVLEFIFSGRLIPLIALPQLLSRFSYFLPFRYFVSLPLEILTGKLTLLTTLAGLFAAVIWLLFYLFIYYQVWQRGLKKYTSVGA